MTDIKEFQEKEAKALESEINDLRAQIKRLYKELGELQNSITDKSNALSYLKLDPIKYFNDIEDY